MTTSISLQKGFTLVEVLVAITLLLLVITGPMQILTRSNHSTAYATEQMTAWFLAQEGLEMAQQGRDWYLLQYFSPAASLSNPWQMFAATTSASVGKFKPCFQSSTGCDITLNNSGAITVIDCAVTSCQLYLLPSQRMQYQHTSSGATLTPYTRVIKMQETGAGREVAATSTVTWRTGSLIASQSVVETTTLFNIYDTN
jgi:prepilin-type N-terminal cleavage/methylation domain-containing protein